MTNYLHKATIGTYSQLLPAAGQILDKAEAYCRDNGIAQPDMVAAALAEDMFPLGKQFEQIVGHSAMALEAVRAGTFSPSTAQITGDFDLLRGFVDQAQQIVSGFSMEELDSLVGNSVLLKAGGMELKFAVPDFLLSFSLPNFYFHYTTAYDILRSRGVPVGKLDYVGQLRLQA